PGPVVPPLLHQVAPVPPDANTTIPRGGNTGRPTLSRASTSRGILAHEMVSRRHSLSGQPVADTTFVTVPSGSCAPGVAATKSNRPVAHIARTSVAATQTKRRLERRILAPQ